MVKPSEPGNPAARATETGQLGKRRPASRKPANHGAVAGPTEPGPPSSMGVYGITVASDLVGTGVQNLRAYERAGLVDPTRTSGGNRLYSSDDVVRLRRIQQLLSQGLNLAGISLVLDLQDDNRQLRERLTANPSAGTQGQPPAATPGREG